MTTAQLKKFKKAELLKELIKCKASEKKLIKQNKRLLDQLIEAQVCGEKRSKAFFSLKAEIRNIINLLEKGIFNIYRKIY